MDEVFKAYKGTRKERQMFLEAKKQQATIDVFRYRNAKVKNVWDIERTRNVWLMCLEVKIQQTTNK